MRQNRDMIVDVADEMRHDSADGHGLNPDLYELDDLYDCVSNCVGWRINEVHLRLAQVAFEEGAEVARKSIWY